jgi:hypothetical protein
MTMRDLIEKTGSSLEALITASLQDFCNGYRWMFEKDIKPTLASTETIPVSDLKRSAQGIIGMNNVSYFGETCPRGNFQVLFEKDAVFSMGGLTIMQPIPRIREDSIKANEEDAIRLVDSVGECGNLLIGSFSKIFREGGLGAVGLEDKLEMLLHLPVLIGKIELPEMEGVETVEVFTYQLELNDLHPFRVKVIFPSA